MWHVGSSTTPAGESDGLESVEPEPALTVDGAWWHPDAVTNAHLRISASALPLAAVFDVVRDVAVQGAGVSEGRTDFRCT